ncbi:MAG TPA: flagellar export chaperone FliS [Kofleriaceae bacterium]|nr:flagellar export chaperone FliS [Kofleriaceae bacterium]
MYSNAMKAYRRADLESAPKTEVLDRLFGRLESDLRAGQTAVAQGDVVTRAQSLDHATRILTELIAALDPRAAPELCSNLEGLYRYCLTCISRATLERSVRPLEQALGIVATLRASFAEAALAGTPAR